MEKGYLAFILHAHLPFVRHPEHESFLEESWFYEGVIETYIPLIIMLNRLLEDKVDFKITLSLSPTLLAMFEDELLNIRLEKKIKSLIELSEKEIWRNKDDSHLAPLARMYNEMYCEFLKIYSDRYHHRLINAFKEFDRTANIELITCGATHGYLPLMELYPQAARAQIEVAVNSYKNIFGHIPKGIWLPECGYYPGLDSILKDAGIRYFILDTHGILFGEPRPRFGVYNPYLCKSGVAVFGRDVESSKAVWSAIEGYPGDFNYREFYRDIGYDLDYDYIKGYLNGDGTRIATGIKYHKITGKGDYKEYYNPQIARETANNHAGNFVFNRVKQIEYLHREVGRKPIVVAPYDAELFGHWWFEGIEWLGCVIRKTAADQNVFKLTTPAEYLSFYQDYQVISPALSSWGWKGYSEVWLDGSNDWIYSHLHKITERLIGFANKFPRATGDLEKALNHLARELLLAQSSDWPFMMKTNACADYATQRVKDHIYAFNKLYSMIEGNNIDQRWLNKRIAQYNLFPSIDYRIYQNKL
ncbi:MAG: DUF1957 domain-containing protein [Candidatus Omnitrophica bacterium]|nr:DUF1957 domain-containing protein [Candidatus Omnitrophota bacterium]